MLPVGAGTGVECCGKSQPGKQAGRAIQDKGISESRNTEAEEAARVAQETSVLIRLPSANQRVVEQLDRLIGGEVPEGLVCQGGWPFRFWEKQALGVESRV